MTENERYAAEDYNWKMLSCMFNAALDDIGSTKWKQCVTEI